MARAGDRERWSDRELLAAIADRDGLAFSAFYRRHLSRVLAYLARETGNSEASADLTAEVFAAVLLAAKRYRAEHDTSVPWLFGIARNTLGASRRRGLVEDRARQRLGFEAIEFSDSDVELTEAIAAQGHAPLSELVESLPEHERHAVHARIVQERSYAEIARELRCSEFVVRKRVSRGLARVRAQMKER